MSSHKQPLMRNRKINHGNPPHHHDISHSGLPRILVERPMIPKYQRVRFGIQAFAR